MNKILTYLDQIRERRERATKGPWFQERHPSKEYKFLGKAWVRIPSIPGSASHNFIAAILEDDAEFIAASISTEAKLEAALRIALRSLDYYTHEKHYMYDLGVNAKDALTAIEKILNGEALGDEK